ncbi:MAG: DUF4373 domain-containing protein [Lachnospiraceae bacterium]|nr:DUF4373 domain-containing protein [Lachnospiraceae bacterium]
MARPKQDGLLYFSFDTDFFYADKRIKRLHSKYGNDGLIFYIYLLTEIYRNGYYISWDEESAEDATEDLRLREGFTEQVLTYLASRSLLAMSKLANSVTIITSPGIQKRYQEAKKGYKRQIEVDAEIWLLSKEETASCIKVTQNPSNSEKNPSNSEKNPSNSEKNCIKESKVNKSKVNKRENTRAIEPAKRFNDFVSAYPKSCNRYLVEHEYASLLLTGSVTEDDLVQCAINYAQSCESQKTPERYIKNAENFLKDFSFQQYLPEKYKTKNSVQIQKKNSFHNFKQRDYDFEKLEEMLIKNRIGGTK